MTLSTDNLIDLLRCQLADMEPNARLEVLDKLMDGYCPHCGGPGGRSCQCWNDE